MNWLKSYMSTVRNKRVGLFGTLGAWPDSDHARQCMEQAVTDDGSQWQYRNLHLSLHGQG
jgi:hypothetical protein